MIATNGFNTHSSLLEAEFSKFGGKNEATSDDLTIFLNFICNHYINSDIDSRIWQQNRDNFDDFIAVLERVFKHLGA